MKHLTKYILILALVALPLSAFAAGVLQPPIGGSDTSGNSFVPLTNIPGVIEQGTATTLPFFLNGIYKLAIGIGATLAVLQIMRAGIMYMSGDSFTEKKEARGLIALSLGGLILLLSPYIVFSIINPKILNLSLDFSYLESNPASFESTATRVINVTSAADCTSKGGTVSGDALTIICTVPIDSPAGKAAVACTNFKNPTPTGTGYTCSALQGESYQRVDDTCCANLPAGSQCCATVPEPAATLPDMSLTITVTKYAVEKAVGGYDDYGAIASDAAAFEKYSTACTSGNNVQKKKGVVKNGYDGSITKLTCSDALLAASPQPSLKDSIQCIPTKVSCAL